MAADQLCPRCKVGRDSYILDDKNPFCPHLACHNGITCGKFVLLNEESDYENDSKITTDS